MADRPVESIEAATTDVRRNGDPEPVETDLVGRAIRFPLSENPDQQWRRHFGGWDALRKYFARIRFENDALVLFLGSSNDAAAVEPGLDAVEQAISSANESRQAEVHAGEESVTRLRKERASESARIEQALNSWSEKHTV
jgi:hypothetical protein